MIVVAQKRTDLPPPSPTRLGIVASRKVGCAVARNRAKRLVREAFRQTRHELPGSLDVLVVTTRTAATASLEAIRAELASAVKVLGQRLAKGDG
jgi:ribonuclease P protein component